MRRSAEHFVQLLRPEINVTQDFCEEAGADGLSHMNWNDRCASIGMSQKMMTAPSPNDAEAGARERCD
jgi:hypothetical protein